MNSPAASARALSPTCRASRRPALVLSQVALSLGLRFILTPLVLLTSRRRVIGPLVNCPATALAAVIVTVGLILLNALIVISACRT